jgi:hypothetical protein
MKRRDTMVENVAIWWENWEVSSMIRGTMLKISITN